MGFDVRTRNTYGIIEYGIARVHDCLAFSLRRFVVVGEQIAFAVRVRLASVDQRLEEPTMTSTERQTRSFRLPDYWHSAP